jgi:tRNA A37 threonylcarbamoyladenosine dehydratase
MNSYDARFGGIGRLYGTEGLARLKRSHVCIVGLGGVGSWAVEALARSGIGELTLVDLDDVCVSNVNRQLHALDGEFGKPKVEVLAQRVRAINPDCILHPMQVFFLVSNGRQILETRFDFVLDAIDSPSKKCLLVASCRDQNIPVLITGGAGGRRDPTLVRVTDLAQSSHDRLLEEIRNKLRARHGFPRAPGRFNVDCVYSPEPAVFPMKDGSVCLQRDLTQDLRLDCDSGFGTACFVTGTFGFVAAAHIVRKLANS